MRVLSGHPDHIGAGHVYVLFFRPTLRCTKYELFYWSLASSFNLNRGHPWLPNVLHLRSTRKYNIRTTMDVDRCERLPMGFGMLGVLSVSSPHVFTVERCLLF